MTTQIEDWDSTVHALASLGAEDRQALDCNVWAVALNGTVPLPLAVLMAHYGEEPVLPLAGESLQQHLSAAGLELPPTSTAATQRIHDLAAQTARTSWTLALHRLRPADWLKVLPTPTIDDLAGVKLEAQAAASQLPGRVGPALETALSSLIAQVETEFEGTAALTLAGELLDVVIQGPSPGAINAGLWQALTTLSLAPILDADPACVATD